MTFNNYFLLKISSFCRSSILNIAPWEVIYFDSSSGVGSIIEPLPAVSLNDELQQARASVAKAEADALTMLATKVVAA